MSIGTVSIHFQRVAFRALPLFLALFTQAAMASDITPSVLPSLEGYSNSFVVAINDNSQIAGSSYRPIPEYPYFEQVPVIWTKGVPAALSVPAECMGGYTKATDINNKGQTIGICLPLGMAPLGIFRDEYGNALVIPNTAGGRERGRSGLHSS